jgi:hypothetical protein
METKFKKGDIIRNQRGHVVKLLGHPRFDYNYQSASRSTKRWVVSAIHIEGEYKGYATDQYMLNNCVIHETE